MAQFTSGSKVKPRLASPLWVSDVHALCHLTRSPVLFSTPQTRLLHAVPGRAGLIGTPLRAGEPAGQPAAKLEIENVRSDGAGTKGSLLTKGCFPEISFLKKKENCFKNPLGGWATQSVCAHVCVINSEQRGSTLRQALSNGFPLFYLH